MIRLKLFRRWYELHGTKWRGGDADVRRFIQSVSDLELANLSYTPDPEMALASAVSNKVLASDIDVSKHEQPAADAAPVKDPRDDTVSDPITVF